jgi:ferric-dicitrate binding protein FerR (iron transport regulator)
MSDADSWRLLERFLAGECQPDEAAEVARWLDTNPLLQQYVEALKRSLDAGKPSPGDVAWRRLATTTGIGRPPIAAPLRLETPDARSRGIHAIPDAPVWRLRSAVRRVIDRRGVRVIVAAVVAATVLITVGFGIARVSTPKPAGLPLFGPRELVTDAGETVTTRLSDGTVVRLAPGSRLQVMKNVAEREVWLTGRAYFAVAKDSTRPFRVRTHAGEALVMGTRFDLEARDRTLQVLVVEGRVAVSARGTTVQVGPMEMTRVLADKLLPVSRVDDVQPLLRWLDKFIAFEETPLQDVASEMERRFGMRVEVADKTLGARTVTGWSSAQTPRDLLMRICVAVSAHCSISDTLTVIEP